MKKNIKLTAIILTLVVIVSATLIGSIRGAFNKDSAGSEDVTPVANVMKDENNTKESKYGSYTYNKYKNPRFGYSIEYPSFLTEVSESKNGDGVVLKDKDNSVVVILSGFNNEKHKTAEEFYNEYLKNTTGIVNKKIVDNFFMITAENEKITCYIYEIVGEGSVNTFVVGYPKEEQKEFEKIINQMKKSFETPQIDKTL